MGVRRALQILAASFEKLFGEEFVPVGLGASERRWRGGGVEGWRAVKWGWAEACAMVWGGLPDGKIGENAD